MKTLKDHIRILKDLRRQHEIMSYRYYIRDSQAILLELIAREMENWSVAELIPEDLYESLSNPERLATNDIEDLCLLYRRVVLLTAKAKEHSTSMS
ncbi:MAG: hypothetical protein ACFFCW_04470 [Candidatus Hodarchaeota archaeon]